MMVLTQCQSCDAALADRGQCFQQAERISWIFQLVRHETEPALLTGNN